MRPNQDVIKKLFLKNDINVQSIADITTGKFNSSYVAEVSSSHGFPHQKVVIRIAPPDDQGLIFYEKNMMKQEPFVHQQVKEQTKIPVPYIYVYDDSRRWIDRDYLIMEFIPGNPLSNVSLSSANSQAIMEKTGSYLRELHEKCQTDQFGYLGAHQVMKPQKSWPEAFQVMWSQLIDDIKDCGVYNQNEALQLKKALDTHLDKFKTSSPASLLHMDIWSQNIMVDHSGKISGIVDWDRALWGDPEIEFAVLDYCGFNNDNFWKGYGKQPEKDDFAKIRGIFYHFYEVQKYLVIWTLRRPDPVGVSSYKSYALESLKKLL